MKRIIALTLCLVLCMGLCVNVFAANENNTKGVVFSVELDKPNLTVSDEDQTVRMTFTANKEFETCSVSYTASTDEFPVTALKGGANMPAATVNPVTKMLSWNSNDGNVVKMQEFGIVDVKIPANTPAGTYELGFSKLKLSENYGADIWESTATAYATLTIAPAPVAVSNITLNKNTLALTVGGSETLTATVYPENATNKDVTWSSDNENAATVDANGTVTAVGEGEAIITATTEDGKYTATCTVKVSPAPVAANGVTLTPDKTTLNVGEKQTLTATVLPAYATNKNVTWVSSDTSVATVENGVVTAVGKGTATITVTTEDGGYTATCEVTVKLPVSAVTLNETSTALVGRQYEAADRYSSGLQMRMTAQSPGRAVTRTLRPLTRPARSLRLASAPRPSPPPPAARARPAPLPSPPSPSPSRRSRCATRRSPLAGPFSLSRSSRPQTPRSAMSSGRALIERSRRSMRTVVSEALLKAK